MKARVHVMLKDGVLDPQGEAVRHALGSLGFEGGTTEDTVREMCERLLANTVIESYSVDLG